MSYIRKNGNGMMGLAGTGTMCRTGPAFFKDGNWWVPIRDTDGKEYPLMQTNELAALAVCAAGSTSGSTAGGIFDSLLKSATDILKAKVTPGQVTNVTSAPGGGMSTNTKLLIAGGAVVGGVLLLRHFKK